MFHGQTKLQLLAELVAKINQIQWGRIACMMNWDRMQTGQEVGYTVLQERGFYLEEKSNGSSNFPQSN